MTKAPTAEFRSVYLDGQMSSDFLKPRKPLKAFSPAETSIINELQQQQHETLAEEHQQTQHQPHCGSGFQSVLRDSDFYPKVVDIGQVFGAG